MTDKLTQFSKLLSSYNSMVDEMATLNRVVEVDSVQTIPTLVAVVGEQAAVLNALIDVIKPERWDGYGEH